MFSPAHGAHIDDDRRGKLGNFFLIPLNRALHTYDDMIGCSVDVRVPGASRFSAWCGLLDKPSSIPTSAVRYCSGVRLGFAAGAGIY